MDAISLEAKTSQNAQYVGLSMVISQHLQIVATFKLRKNNRPREESNSFWFLKLGLCWLVAILIHQTPPEKKGWSMISWCKMFGVLPSGCQEVVDSLMLMKSCWISPPRTWKNPSHSLHKSKVVITFHIVTLSTTYTSPWVEESIGKQTPSWKGRGQDLSWGLLHMWWLANQEVSPSKVKGESMMENKKQFVKNAEPNWETLLRCYFIKGSCGQILKCVLECYLDVSMLRAQWCHCKLWCPTTTS